MDNNLVVESSFFLKSIGPTVNTLLPTWKQKEFDTIKFLIFPMYFFIGFVYLGYPINERFNQKSKIITLAILTVIFFGTYFVQYLTWTPVGSLKLDSAVNTRYFLPIFALVPFVFNINRNKEDDRIKDYAILFSIIFLSGMILSIIFQFY